MNIQKLLFTAVAALVLVGTAVAQPVAARTYRLYVAPLGPSVEGIMNDFKPLITEAGRKITALKEIQRINAGKITGIEFTHAHVTGTVPQKWFYQDVYVAPLFGNAFSKAWEVVRFQKMADKQLVDVEIIQQINIGKVTGVRLYFAE